MRDQLDEDLDDRQRLAGLGRIAEVEVGVPGVARLVDDRRKVDEVWNEEMRVWFPGGKQDPRLTLLRVDPTQGEFWDNSGANAGKYLFKAGVAYFRGERPTDDETEHGRIALGRHA